MGPFDPPSGVSNLNARAAALMSSHACTHQSGATCCEDYGAIGSGEHGSELGACGEGRQYVGIVEDIMTALGSQKEPTP